MIPGHATVIISSVFGRPASHQSGAPATIFNENKKFPLMGILSTSGIGPGDFALDDAGSRVYALRSKGVLPDRLPSWVLAPGQLPRLEVRGLSPNNMQRLYPSSFLSAHRPFGNGGISWRLTSTPSYKTCLATRVRGFLSAVARNSLEQYFNPNIMSTNNKAALKDGVSTQ